LKPFTKKNMPGRVLVLILLAFSSTFAFFKGTWIDLCFAACTAMVAGLICLAASNNPLFSKIQDILLAIVAALIATIGITLVPNGTCFAAEFLGTLFWFLYGSAFMISLTEIYNGQLLCGVTRLALALINTFGLAFGSSLGCGWQRTGERTDSQSQAGIAPRQPNTKSQSYILFCFIH
jgi:uncharacterized membrane protein YjjP (DUF1212 family)